MTARDTQVDNYIGNLEPWALRLVGELRRLIMDTVPDVQETFKWNAPTYEYNGLLCGLNPARGYVRLQFYRGAELNDPEGLLEGTGKGLRHVKVHNLDDTNREALKALVLEAAAVNLEK